MADRFFIAPYDAESGLQTNVRPWLIPDTAFAELNNAYVFRGRVRKRFGSRWLSLNSLLSRLRINLGTITGGALSGNVRTILADAGLETFVGQSFSVGTNVIDNIIFTVNNPAAGDQQMLRTDNSGDSATYNLVNSDFNITGLPFADGTSVYFYPGLPVMGLLTYELAAINNEFLIGFDTRYAYHYNDGWERLASEATPGAAVWTGDNSQFFWAATWTGANASDRVFFVTNFNQNEPNFMRYYNGVQWENFRPQISSTPDYLFSARIIVPFKNRLVVFNTWEGTAGPGINYPNRCRYSQIGSPLDADAWRQDIPGRGNAIDAPTTEAIVTVEFIKDRLIVFFERSTWEFVYTGNQAYPFTWQQINTELGAESTNSIIPFDKVCIGVGDVGIHACNGSNVDRIDDKIPDVVFQVHNSGEGVMRVYGIRDYYVEMLYWTFPNINTPVDSPYPNRVLVYNYKTGTWSFFDDSITCFGYFQPSEGISWDSNNETWNVDTSWDSGSTQSQFKDIIAGNQEGYTFICETDFPTNAAVLQITDVTTVDDATVLTIIDHNLNTEDNVNNPTYIYIQDAVWSDSSDSLNDQIFQVTEIIDADTVEIGPSAPYTGTYSGGGLVALVSNVSIKTKEYNFYADQGRNAYVSKVDFMVDATPAGQTQIEFYVSTATTPLLQDSAGNGVLLGTGTLDTFPYPDIPFEATASRLWHPVYLQADGEIIQLQLVMNDEQMRDTAIRSSGFQLHAMCIFAQPTSQRLQ